MASAVCSHFPTVGLEIGSSEEESVACDGTKKAYMGDKHQNNSFFCFCFLGVLACKL